MFVKMTKKEKKEEKERKTLAHRGQSPTKFVRSTLIRCYDSHIKGNIHLMESKCWSRFTP